MTVEQYMAAVRRLDLQPYKVKRVYIHRPTGQTIWVQDPNELTAEEREDVIDGLTTKIRGF